MPITNITRGTVLASDVAIADTPLKRMRGLLGRQSLGPKEGLVITRCQSIHMFFMKFPIDVVFIDKNEKVVGLTENIKPFALSPIFWKSACAIELPVGTIDSTKTTTGDQLKIS